MKPPDGMPEMALKVALQLRRAYGPSRFTIDLGENVILVQATSGYEPELIGRVADYLRLLGWRAYESDGPDPRIMVTGRE